MEHVIVFDDGKGTLGPLTDFRAAFDIRPVNIQRVLRRTGDDARRAGDEQQGRQGEEEVWLFHTLFRIEAADALPTLKVKTPNPKLDETQR